MVFLTFSQSKFLQVALDVAVHMLKWRLMPPPSIVQSGSIFGFMLILNFLEIGTRGGGLFLLFIMEALPS
jgi:hypothetical protein